MAEEKIIERIKKLIALAGNNPSEEEAKLAMERANELLVRYNLTLQDVQNTASRENDPVIDQNDIAVRTAHRTIDLLLMEFFFVRMVHHHDHRGGKRKLHIFGRKSNVEIALYIRTYLLHAYKRLWELYSAEHPAAQRISYWEGLYEGLRIQLLARQTQVQEEMALVIRRDEAVDNATHAIYPRLHKSKRNVRDLGAVADGVTDGKNIPLRDGLTGSKPAPTPKLH